MRIRESFPREVEDTEAVWIPMPDGCRLSARIWKPADAQARPVPAVVEYIPYRKRDGTRIRDEPIHRYFAGHGYASIRIDVRGTGESEGLLRDEYTPREQEDGVAALRWIAEQPWCTGRVGLLGKSWGGINALQIAARNPPELGALITVCSTDDRYRDDAHYMGGCLLNENLIWGSALFTINAMPPDPELVGAGWRDTWLRRLEHAPLFVDTWLAHPSRDAYWKQGSVCEDYRSIRCPVYAIGGWADAYTGTIPRLLEGLDVPRRGLIGPWVHVYPHEGAPEPAIGFLQEALRWFDQWLKGRETGILEEPLLRVWMQEGQAPGGDLAERAGRWVAEEAWPSPRIVTRRLVLNRGRLDDRPGPAEGVEIRSPLAAGLHAGAWCPFDVEGELPGDQAEDDALSVVFDSGPLGERLEILGVPVAHLEIASDRPGGMIAVRLNDVHPGGVSERVTYGVLNLAHREGHEAPVPMEPGRRTRVRVPLGPAAHAFAPGHRIRLALSTSYWPTVWPPPEPFTLTLAAGESGLELPVRPPRAGDDALPPFPEPEAARPPPVETRREGRTRESIHRDPETGEITVTTVIDGDEEGRPGLRFLEQPRLEVGHVMVERLSVREGHPESARAEVRHRAVSRRPGWSVRVETRMQLGADRDRFILEASLQAFEGEDRVFSRAWKRRIPRILV